jgi:peptidyl-prolyl cis-trans isomerase C
MKYTTILYPASLIDKSRAAHAGWLILSLGILTGVAANGMAGCARPPEESPVVAIINGKPVTQGEFDYRWSELPAATRSRYEAQGGKKKFLDDLITREILLQEARRIGLDHNPAFQERMERVKEQLMLDELMKDAVSAPVDVKDEEVQAYYDAHRTLIVESLQVRAAHIVLQTETQAKDVKHQLNQGYNFAKLAQRYSIDEATKANGGEFGVYRRGVADPGIEPALLTLKPGIVSEPIETPAGFHLVKVLGREPDEAQRLEAVKERLRRELVADKRRKQLEDALAKMRAHATVRVATASGFSTRDADSRPSSAPDSSP